MAQPFDIADYQFTPDIKGAASWLLLTVFLSTSIALVSITV